MCLIVLAHDVIPIESVNIKDTDVEGSPVKVWGTCDAYADEREPGFMAVGIEENNLYWQNVSDKTIKYALIEVHKTDLRGNPYWGFHQLMRREFVPGYSNRMLEPQRYPSGRVHVVSAAKKMSVAEYQLKPYVHPTCEIRAVFAQFSDGTWTDKQHYGSLPEMVKEQDIRQHGGY
jgi:hypothetical protein